VTWSPQLAFWPLAADNGLGDRHECHAVQAEGVKRTALTARFFEAAMAADVLRGGEALHPADTACTVTVAGGEGGDITIADGPYAQATDVLGGFYLIEASDDKEAASWAARIPAAWRGQVELRPVVPMQNKPGR
jgi:hypothetical protein